MRDSSMPAKSAAADQVQAGQPAEALHPGAHNPDTHNSRVNNPSAHNSSAHMVPDMSEHSGHHHRRGLAVLLPMPHHHMAPAEQYPNIVFVGNPNVGKSTLFNAILGANAAAMNAPGTTVLVERGQLKREGAVWDFVDTPGTASLEALSPDEQVASQAAMGRAGNPLPSVIVYVFDATSPSKSLYLLSQLLDLGRPIVVAVTMLDLAAKQGSSISIAALSQQLPGINFVRVDGRTGQGKDELLAMVAAELAASAQPDAASASSQQLPVSSLPAPGPESSPEEVSAWVRSSANERFDWTARVLSALNPQASESASSSLTFSDKLDRVLLHPVAGIVIFLAVMYLVFEATTALAAPVNDWFDVTVRGWATSAIDWVFSATAGQASLDSWPHSMLVNGLLDGCITVLTFVAPMGIIFMVLSLLEDSGYLARAAFVMDKAMRTIGLDGRAFLPLVVGFGCNLPALASTRTLPDSRQRLMTGLLIPFTSCSARLSVYIVLAYAFFGRFAGLAIFCMYVASILIILGVGLLLRKTQFKTLTTQPFAIGLPPYQMPRLLQLVKSVALRLWAFLTGASSIIITMIIIMWFLAAIPVTAGADGNNSFGHVDQVRDSLYGSVASAVAPVFTPAGFNDWHASAALITGFVAKEVVVGSMSQSYQLHSADDASEQDQGKGTLGQAVRKSFEQSSHGHGSAAAAAFMIFVLAYTPCLATIAEMRRQYGGKIAAQSVGMGLVIAYVLAIIVFQIGRLL
ncbi:ferrous iron transport protein B [Bombiscardovia nodaiensis]|uniref:Ferrous iron transport protein B n=1 Tax=Bombiscardovia nodaiensis TaxID=2932181 RepID=A0ABN6SDV5_9BIFI|nr:ferrous iron transport protein B [Bombiscardovia nodaiensis]